MFLCRKYFRNFYFVCFFADFTFVFSCSRPGTVRLTFGILDCHTFMNRNLIAFFVQTNLAACNGIFIITASCTLRSDISILFFCGFIYGVFHIMSQCTDFVCCLGITADRTFFPGVTFFCTGRSYYSGLKSMLSLDTAKIFSLLNGADCTLIKIVCSGIFCGIYCSYKDKSVIQFFHIRTFFDGCISTVFTDLSGVSL